MFRYFNHSDDRCNISLQDFCEGWSWKPSSWSFWVIILIIHITCCFWLFFQKKEERDIYMWIRIVSVGEWVWTPRQIWYPSFISSWCLLFKNYQLILWLFDMNNCLFFSASQRLSQWLTESSLLKRSEDWRTSWSSSSPWSSGFLSPDDDDDDDDPGTGGWKKEKCIL